MSAPRDAITRHWPGAPINCVRGGKGEGSGGERREGRTVGRGEANGKGFSLSHSDETVHLIDDARQLKKALDVNLSIADIHCKFTHGTIDSIGDDLSFGMKFKKWKASMIISDRDPFF